ncbi:MAG TPA: medium chain dehydrogenase/reductase family protein [Anaeromyxobacteraceae bacterium]|nr:medium chain dehydrogenase/reductase family protein [Anaeromyxobacteraceae bacterium]
MRAVWITRHGGPEVLEVRESPDPAPGAGEVRIRVRAAGLNFAEVMARLGLYPDAPKPPCVVGYEAAGVVDALGTGVERPAVGARVLAMIRFGGHADTVVAPAAAVLEIPDGKSFEEAAALPVNYATAWLMIFRTASVRAGERVLVHMAAGGVGIAALQLLRTIPDTVAFGTASASKHGALREEGCAHPIDYRTRDYAEEVRALTRGEGVDVVLDPLGGKDWRIGYDLLRAGGRLVAYGFANAARGERRSFLHVAREAFGIPRFNPLKMMGQNRGVAGFNLGHLWNRPDLLRPAMEALAALWREGRIRPRVDSTFPLERAADAHRRIQDRKNVGKVVLVP